MEFYRWKTDSYRRATYHLNPYEDGCYRRLIDEYMTTRQPLPDNDAALARICGISLQDWQLHAMSNVRAFFKQSSGMLINVHCDQELDYQDSKRRFATEKAHKAAIARHSKNKELHATSMLDECLALPEREREREIITNVINTPPVIPPTKNNEGKADESAKPKSERKRKPATYISDDFAPDLRSIAFASEKGFDAESIVREFVDYWKGCGKPMCDWQAVFRNRIGQLAQYRSERQQRDAIRQPHARDVTGAALRAVALRREREAKQGV